MLAVLLLEWFKEIEARNQGMESFEFMMRMRFPVEMIFIRMFNFKINKNGLRCRDVKNVNQSIGS